MTQLAGGARQPDCLQRPTSTGSEAAAAPPNGATIKNSCRMINSLTPQGRELLTHHLEAATSEYAAIFHSPASGGTLEHPPAPGLFGGGGAENAPPTAAAGAFTDDTPAVQPSCL
jgi:hypothetical protein